MINNLVFDWSGTLSNDLQQVYGAVMKMFDHYGVDRISLDEFRESYTLPYMAHARMFGIKASKKDVDAVFARHFRNAGFPALLPGVKSTLAALKSRGKRMIVLSSHNKLFLEEEAKRFFNESYEDFFEKLFGDVQDKVLGIGQVLDEVGFNTDETLIVGDTEHDIAAGRKAGILTAAVLSGYRSRSHLEEARPHYILEDVTGLPNLGIF